MASNFLIELYIETPKNQTMRKKFIKIYTWLLFSMFLHNGPQGSLDIKPKALEPVLYNDSLISAKQMIKVLFVQPWMDPRNVLYCSQDDRWCVQVGKTHLPVVFISYKV